MGRSADYSREKCPVAASLDLIGEPWTLLIIRDAFRGFKRFEQWQKSLGLARNVLAARLKHLVSLGIMNAQPYNERPLRYEYVLTEKGESLRDVILVLYSWGVKNVYGEDAPMIELTHAECGHEFVAGVHCKACHEDMTNKPIDARHNAKALTLVEIYEKKNIKPLL